MVEEMLVMMMMINTMKSMELAPQPGFQNVLRFPGLARDAKSWNSILLAWLCGAGTLALGTMDETVQL